MRCAGRERRSDALSNHCAMANEFLQHLAPGIKIVVNFYQREMAKSNNRLDHSKIILDDTEMLGLSALNNRVDELDEVLNRAE